MELMDFYMTMEKEDSNANFGALINNVPLAHKRTLEMEQN